MININVDAINLRTDHDPGRGSGSASSPRPSTPTSSRGLLHRRLAEDGRTSRFDPDEVDGLARRGRPRRGGRGTGAVDVVLSTSLTEIADGALRYRGNDVVGLVGTYSFEDVAELLWTGILAEGHRWQALPGRAGTRARGDGAVAPGRRRTVTACASRRRRSRRPGRCGADLRPEAVIAARACAFSRRSSTRSPTGAPPTPHPHRTAAGGAALDPSCPPRAVTAPRVRALDAALVLLADHELASSTLAARIAASTRSDPYDVVLAGLGAVSGPVHAGAGVAAYRILREARDRVRPAAPSAKRCGPTGRSPGSAIRSTPTATPGPPACSS